jgi:hypothetical protein
MVEQNEMLQKFCCLLSVNDDNLNLEYDQL